MSAHEFLEVFSEINRYSALPGILLFLLMKGRPQLSRIIFYILIASFLADFANYFFIRYVYQNSFIISNSWFLINYLLLAFLFLHLIPSHRKLLWLLTGVFLLGSLISFVFYYSFLESNTFIRVFTSASITFLCLITYYDILEKSPTDNLFSYPVFWTITALFLLSSVTLLKNIFDNYLIFKLQVTTEAYEFIRPLNLSFNILKNALFALVIYQCSLGRLSGIINTKP